MTLETFEKETVAATKPKEPMNKIVIILIVILVLSWGAMGYHYFIQMPKMAK